MKRFLLKALWWLIARLDLENLSYIQMLSWALSEIRLSGKGRAALEIHPAEDSDVLVLVLAKDSLNATERVGVSMLMADMQPVVFAEEGRYD